MSTKRKISIGLLAAAIVFVGTALPSIAAPEKIFSVKTPTSLPQTATMQTGVPVIATIKNETPTGNSSINSLNIVIASGPANFKITGWDPSTISGSGSLSPNGLSLSFSNMSPLKNNQSVGVKLFVTVPAATSCANSNVIWTSNAWTGSGFTGTTFRLLGVPNSQLTTTLSASCKLQFVGGREPQDAVKSTTITNTDLNYPTPGDFVQVELLVGGVRSNALNGQSVTLTKGGTGTGTVLGSSADLAGDGVAEFGNLSIDLPGDYTLTASTTSPGVTPSDPSPTFTIFDAGLGCGGANEGAYSEQSTVHPEGSIGLEKTSEGCLGVTVENSLVFNDPGAINAEQWSVLKGGTNIFQGTITYSWELPGTTPIQWTQVSWNGLTPPGSDTVYVDLQRCNPIPLPSPAEWAALFPEVDGVQQQMCLLDQDLAVVNGVYVQTELVALLEDAFGRKG